MKNTLLNLFQIIVLFNCTFVLAQPPCPDTEQDNKALPVIEIMRYMDMQLNALSTAIILVDYPAIALSADAIANHPKIAKVDLQRLFERLGPRKAGFIACDAAVHRLAGEIVEEAALENIERILVKHSAMLDKVVECHQAYRMK